MVKILSLVLRYMPFIFFLGILLFTILALVPGKAVPAVFVFWDKAQHVSAFIMLSVSGGLAFPGKARLTYLSLGIYGALIEVMQSTLTTTRHGDFFDWLADSIGILIGAGICTVLAGLIARHTAVTQS